MVSESKSSKTSKRNNLGRRESSRRPRIVYIKLSGSNLATESDQLRLIPTLRTNLGTVNNHRIVGVDDCHGRAIHVVAVHLPAGSGHTGERYRAVGDYAAPMAAEIVGSSDAQLAEERHSVFGTVDVERRAIAEGDRVAAAGPHALRCGHVVVEDAERRVAEQIPLAVAVIRGPTDLRADEVVFDIKVVRQFVGVIVGEPIER